MLVIDPPAAPSCTAQFTAELLVPLTVAMNDWVPPWIRFAIGGEIEIPIGIGISTGFPPPPPQPVTCKTRTSRTRAPILVFMGTSLSAHGVEPQFTKREPWVPSRGLNGGLGADLSRNAVFQR